MAEQNKKQNNELELEKMDQVSGGAINERQVSAGGLLGLFGKKKTVYDVTRDDTGEVIKTYDNVNEASNLDRYMNTSKKN